MKATGADNDVGSELQGECHVIGRNGQPRDVSEAILYLAGDDADWITGAVLPVDGGVTAGRGA